MPAPGRPTTSRADRHSAIGASLLQAVADLLRDDKSYAELSINEIAAAAGIAKSTFYQYFTGKNGLLRNLLEEVATTGMAAESWLEFDGPVTQESLTAAIQRRCDAYVAILPLMGAAFDAVYFDPEVREVGERVLRQLDDELTACIVRGQQAGTIDPMLEPQGTARWLNWMLARGSHQLLVGVSAGEASTIVAGFSHLVWLMLFAPTAPHA